MKPTYAIGDIHGRDSLLEKMYERIIHDPFRENHEEAPTVIHIGDYIDGGPESDKVLDRVIRGRSEFESVALLGNHEALMLECLETDERDTWWNWISNGGDRTLKALRISTSLGGYDSLALRDALGEERITWLKNLPIYHIVEKYLFVHAGIVPGVPLKEQKTKDMLWIRSRFLESKEEHPFIVVHGHTQTIEPELLPNRIGIDTGEARPKKLTCVALEPDKEPRFLSVSEE